MQPNAFPDGAQIGAWRVTPSAGRLTRGGEERAIEPKVMDLLVLLAARAGQVVSHEEILSTLWPDTIVGDDTLARGVSKLRKAFDDDAKTPAYVETIAKRGYRLIADVELAPAQTPPRRLQRWGFVAAAAVAVLAVSGLAWLSLQPPQSDAGATLVARAKDYYFQYTRADNEAAIALYERVIETDADNAEATRASLAQPAGRRRFYTHDAGRGARHRPHRYAASSSLALPRPRSRRPRRRNRAAGRVRASGARADARRFG